MMHYDVILIGGGVVGTLTARALSKYQLKIALVEKGDDVAMGATKANSAIVHGGYDPLPGTCKARLNVRGSEMMEEICGELSVPYRKNGSLVLAFSKEEEAHLALLLQRGEANRVQGLRLLDADALFALEPKLSRDATAALLCTSAAIVSPYELAIAAMGNAMDNGADLYTEMKVTSIQETAQGYRISDGKTVLHASYLINCAGIGGAAIAAMLGEEIPLTARIGEYLLLDKTAGPLVSHTVFRVPGKEGKGVLVTPTVHGNLLVGPTSEEREDKECTATDAQGLAEVRQKASLTLPCLPLGETITSFAGLRASHMDGDFIIRPAKHSPHAIHAIGIDSPGLSASPAIAEELLALLREAGLKLIEKEGYNPYRPSPVAFSSLPFAQKQEIIKEHPAFGRIVCRCEQVSEGEILLAIAQNPPARSVDAVKRRVRSGMGRCQGGFCTPSVVSLLARHWSKEKTMITKCGGDSTLLAATLDQCRGGRS